MTDLLRADLVSAAVGRAGGYTLRAHPEGVSVLDIVKAVEGDPRRQRCSLRAGPCRRN
jgi:DNA-binding IscR family transcriptional regulator